MFKPESGKDTLSNPDLNGNAANPTWKINYNEKIKAIGFSDKVYTPKYSLYLFARMFNLEYFDGTNLNTENTISFASMFFENKKMKVALVGNFNTSQAKDFTGMFGLNEELETIDVSKWDTSKVERMTAMFVGDVKLKQLDVSKWNTQSLKTTNSMFGDTTSLKKIDISNWNTSVIRNWTNLSSYGVSDMFNSSGVEELDFSKWIISKGSLYGGRDWDKYDSLPGFISNLKGIKKITLPKFNILYLNFKDVIDLEGYTNLWYKDGNPNERFTLTELGRDWSIEKAGAYIRVRKEYNISFETNTDEKIETIKRTYNENITLPTPTVDNPGYKFLGWSKTQDGEVITDTTNIVSPKEEITLYAKWEKVNNITKQRTPIESTTVYQGDNNLDKGQRNEDAGQIGEKEIITTYKVTPITGELTNPTTMENIITPMKSKVIKIGTKPVVEEKEGRKITIAYTVNPNTGEITESKREEVIKNKIETSKGEPEVLETPKEFVGGVNPNDAPVVEELTELKVATIKDNKRSVLKVIKEDEEPKEITGYKNTGKVEVDKDGYKVYIYEKVETQKTTTEEKPIDSSNKEENKKEVVSNKKEDNLKENNNKETIKKQEELPKTSSSMLSTVGLFSIFGLRKNRKKDK